MYTALKSVSSKNANMSSRKTISLQLLSWFQWLECELSALVFLEKNKIILRLKNTKKYKQD